ncbi:hypothetical protein V1318_18680 [Lysobacter sp. CCNWLW3]|uniref:hypothetical protein n=1 Tax=unclassified Lysobacter TaxID=2635362 RepID=UPI002FD71C78
MFDGIKRFLFGDKREITEVVESHLLGKLSFNDDVEAWESVAKIGGEEIKFHIAGDWGKEQVVIGPSLRLIGEAEQLAARFEEFSVAVREFIEAQIDQNPALNEWRDELRRLKIAQICFFWAERPSDGEIVFSSDTGGDAGRIWACAIKNGKPAPTLSFSS